MGACGKHKWQSCVHCGNGLLRRHRKLQINLFVRGNVNCLEWFFIFYLILRSPHPHPHPLIHQKKTLEFCQSINFFWNLLYIYILIKFRILQKFSSLVRVLLLQAVFDACIFNICITINNYSCVLFILGSYPTKMYHQFVESLCFRWNSNFRSIS